MSGKKLLEWSRRAERDLGAIHDYIAADNPAAAAKVTRFILIAAAGIIDFPMIGHEGGERGSRELVLSRYPYTIVYRLTSNKIRVLAVVHQSRMHP